MPVIRLATLVAAAYCTFACTAGDSAPHAANTPSQQADVDTVDSAVVIAAPVDTPTVTPRSYEECMHQTETNIGYSNCGKAESSRLEHELQLAWEAVRKDALKGVAEDPGESYAVERLNVLEEEQRAWRRFHDAACTHWLHGFGREGEVIHYPGCKTALVQQRVAYLQHLLNPLGP